MINITSSEDLGIHELNQASDLIYKAAGYDSDNDYDQEHGEIIHGFTVDNSLNDEVRVTVIATGLDQPKEEQSQNVKENQTQERRYQIPDHDYNNPQTSIDILNSNKSESIIENDSSVEYSSKERSAVENPEDIQVFGDDLDVPTYLRNRLGD